MAHAPASSTGDGAYAALEERTGGLERAMNRQEQELAGLGKELRDGLRSISDTMAKDKAEIQSDLARRSQPQWNIYIAGFAALVAVVGGLGTLYLAPIQTRVDELAKTQVRDFNQNVETYQQFRRDFRLEFKAIDQEKIDRREAELLTRLRDKDIDDVRRRLDRLEERGK